MTMLNTTGNEYNNKQLHFKFFLFAFNVLFNSNQKLNNFSISYAVNLHKDYVLFSLSISFIPSCIRTLETVD